MERGNAIKRLMRMTMKRTGKFLLVAICLFWMTGCAGTSTTLTALPIETSTPLSQPTVAPAPSATVTSATTSTLTPEPGLRTKGPYFSYFRQVDGVYQLVLMDADGGGRRVIELPQAMVDSFPYKQFDPDTRLVSPNGHWLAFYTGTANILEEKSQGKYDLALNILDLETGNSQIVTPLLSKDYPNNFTEAARKLNDQYIDAMSLHNAFMYGITQALAWSLDGRYLAFAGQMDGLSSDLYVYDTIDKTTIRLTDGPEELQWIQWSPDGEWILHGSFFIAAMGSTFDVYVARRDGSSARYLTTTTSGASYKEWLNSHTYFEYEAENVVGKHRLRLIDINTGEIIEIWDDPFKSFAINKTGEWLALIMQDNSFFGEVPSPYLINLKTHEKLRVEIPINEQIIFDPQPIDLNGSMFALIGIKPGQNSYFLSTNGSITPIEFENTRKISISPNSNYWVVVNDRSIKIFSSENILIRELFFPFEDAYPNYLSWRSDSLGLFVISDGSVYSINIPNGEITLVERHMIITLNSYQYLWIKK
ncbi:MAG: hypothetical protein ABI904_04565 [Chloroflexota bacterium]